MLSDIEKLRSHIQTVASGPRPYGSAELENARQYCIGQLKRSGFVIERQEFDTLNDVGTLRLGERLSGVNIVAHRVDADLDQPRLCIGAHLDSCPGTPGADDNASGVAALLELARLLPTLWPAKPALEVELVVFDLEENGMLGGREHARRYKSTRSAMAGMISLEMLGYRNREKGSQSLPRALTGLYPDTGDFLAIIGNQNSTRLINGFKTGASAVAGLPLETLEVPENGNLLQATRLSDHSPFWDAGFPALMVTDTSFMRNPHYHTAGDTISTLDFDFLQQVTDGCARAVQHLISRGLGPA